MSSKYIVCSISALLVQYLHLSFSPQWAIMACDLKHQKIMVCEEF